MRVSSGATECISSREEPTPRRTSPTWASLRARATEVDALRAELEETRRELKRKPQAPEATADPDAVVTAVDGVNVVVQAVDGFEGDALLDLSDRLNQRHTPAAVVLGSTGDGKVSLVANFDDAVASRVSAADVIRGAAPLVGGGGGGRPTMRAATDAARKDRDTLGGIVEVVATGAPPGLGSYAEKHDRLDAQIASALMGIQAVKAVEVGDGLALARRRGTDAHDEVYPGLERRTNHAGGIEAGMSNGEPIVVRAAMKPLPTLMRPLDSVDLETGEPAKALVERSDVQAVEALAVVAEAVVAWELARSAKDKFGGDAISDFVAAHRAYLERIQWPRTR